MPGTGFKLFAITALEGCNPKYLKILRPDEPYYLYDNYRIGHNQEGLETVTVSPDIVPRIFDIGELKINISAIVGKNGAGKSSLVELIYVMFYNIAKQQKIVSKKDDDGEIYRPVPDIRAAIYFALDDKLFKLEQYGWDNTFYEFNANGEGYQNKGRIMRPRELEKLFYNIVVNYSHYALNSLPTETGHWLKSIFHKNDAYQTPIVLNPYRDAGNININTENYLVRSRLLVNILGDMAASLWFNKNEKVPTRLYFSVDYKKFTLSKHTGKIVLNRIHHTKRYILPTVYEVFFGDKEFEPDDNLLNTYAKEYILNKLFTIVGKYKHYFKHQGFSTPRTNNAQLVSYLEALKEDESHIAFKLKQALNFLRFPILPKDKEVFEIPVKDLKEAIAAVTKDHDLSVIELVPPSFLMVDIEFSGSEDRFNKLSSGEKQKIYAYSSLIYHLKNLDSILQNPVKKNRPYEKLIRYYHINVIFDEIELYYHPDLQRRFINDLLINLRQAKLQHIAAINFIFITHSPFVLSDIPEQQTLYLDMIDRQTWQRFPGSATFGGNVHDLLANSFFLDQDGYMGEYAKVLIMQVYNYLTLVINSQGTNDGTEETDGWTKNKARLLVDMVGEPLIRSSLNELYSSAFLATRSLIDQEIRRLQLLKATKPE
jgi:predicted ATP-binding protein involved in virulence